MNLTAHAFSRLKTQTCSVLGFLSKSERLLLTLLLCFFTSRLLILGISFVAHNNFQIDSPDRTWSQHIEILWSKFDVEWYKSVTLNGYEEEPFSAEEKRNWAFLPLYPLIVKGVLLPFEKEDFFLVASLVSSVLTISALGILAYTFKERLQSRTTLWLLYLVSAGSFYFSIPYNEGLALFLVALTFRLTHCNRYLWAALIAGLGVITRVQLLALILIPLVPLLLEKRNYLKCAGALILCGMPLALHMLYLKRISGNAFAFFDMQSAWGNTNPFPGEAVVVFIQNGLSNGPCQWLHLLVWLLFALCFIRNYKKLPLNEGLFCVVVFLISTSAEQFWGAYRYVLLLTPLYIALANEQEWFKQLYIYFNLIVGTIYIIAFVSNHGIVI